MTAPGQGPNIAELVALPAALDTDFMSTRLAPLFGESNDMQVSGARLLGGKRGERAVVAYDTVTRGGRGPVLIGKAFRDRDRARRLHDLLDRLYRTDFAGNEYRVPQPLAHLADLGMVLYAAAPGRALDGFEDTERADRVAAAARWLVKLHRSRVDLHRRLDLAAETRNLVEWAELVVKEQPSAARPTGRLVERIRALADRIDVHAGVAIHKDFHYQHTLFEGSRVTVIDLDEARAGDPAFDVAHFAANLRLLGLRERTSTDELLRLEGAFIDSYASCTGYEIDARHEFFFAYTCLKIAKQLVTGRGPLPVPAGAEKGQQVDLILREGLRCPCR
jgi:Phosphotransferase enzyme family